MPLFPLLIGSSTAVGIGYFCIDLYRNRRRLAENPAPEADLTCYELGDIPRGDDLQAVGQAVGQAISRAGHGIAEASSECVGGGIGHCVETIAHVVSHH